MPLVDILERGYFPKELPHPFCTNSFAQVVVASAGLPPDFTPVFRRNSRLRQAKASRYSHARGGLLRRPLSICNPLAFYRLANELDQHWTTLAPNVQGTPLSSTNPVLSPSGRAIQGSHKLSSRPTLAVETRLNNRYILRTDISRFYQSIYTHSLPWAIHTKPFAKTNRGMTHLGNRLDALVRGGQDGQTVGIPIGPDTSLVLAEILMQACDRELIAALPGVRGYRFIDDYELGFMTRTEAENAFHVIESILAGYELALNPRKTFVEKLPFRIAPPWAAPLRSFVIRPTSRGQATDLVTYFDLAAEYNLKYPDEAVLQFAVGRLRSLAVAPENWLLFQRLLLGLAVPDPAALPFVLEAILDRVKRGAAPERSEIGQALNTIIMEHSSLRHSSEVAWSLWGCLALNIPLAQVSADAVALCEDSCVALLALHCQSVGLVSGHLDTSLWSSYMTSEALYEDQWLLAYEANVKGWLPSVGRRDHVDSDPNFSYLKANGVSFYDVLKAVPATPVAPLPVPHPVIPPPVHDADYGGGGDDGPDDFDDDVSYP